MGFREKAKAAMVVTRKKGKLGQGGGQRIGKSRVGWWRETGSGLQGKGKSGVR